MRILMVICERGCATSPRTTNVGGIGERIGVLVREGHHVNGKKIQRLWREEGLRVPPRRHKRLRVPRGRRRMVNVSGPPGIRQYVAWCSENG